MNIQDYLIDKDDTRDALAEVFTERARGEQGGGGGGGGGEQGGDLFRQRLNEASYAAAFNAARTLLASSRCPCVLLDSPLAPEPALLPRLMPRSPAPFSSLKNWFRDLNTGSPYWP